MKVFISWSGARSHEIALALRDWLPRVLPGVEPWVSTEDIDKGARWNPELGRQLDAARFGVICLVPENLRKEWVIFEAGAIARSFETARVAPLLVEVEVRDVPGPLAQFQCTVFEKEDMRRLMRSINRAMDEPVDRLHLDGVFDEWWLELDGRIQRIQAVPSPVRRVEEVVPRQPATMPQEQVKILRLLAQHPGLFPFTRTIAQRLDENQTRTQYHLDRLLERKLIGHRLNANQPPAYYLTSDGRAYAVENNLDRMA